MAQRTVVELLDDIDGKTADETVTFSIDGVTYEIDLSSKNADKLRNNLTPYVEKARKAGGRQAGRSGRGTGTRTTHTRERSADIRAWAKQHGITVNDRGRIPAQVVEAYEANDPSRAKDSGKKVPQTKFQGA
ncbi:histone-like nucleoid-structuring protein Lsr2 [Actinomadura sp. HBU206391]|uniref:histone-like nucleoid-structuring protein Lsr2 n=1 Tax=Actinomadura sp. HBU206391 TaxID=2731692 RepID=UPI0016504709|nr:Lsr2 family protein [Actinomadura sp. HBU206391]MBC6462933.1 Lsr2 family protein [Actinomadura sp. HBU206391]